MSRKNSRSQSISHVRFQLDDDEILPAGSPIPEVSPSPSAASPSTPTAASDSAPDERAIALANARRTMRLANVSVETEQGITFCQKLRTPDVKRTIRQSLSFMLLLFYPTLTGVLFGMYYLTEKYSETVWACAIIWLVFIAAFAIGLTYSWRVRVAEDRIRQAQIEEDERHIMERALHVNVKNQPASDAL